jgi:3-oxoacyl-[acyl-carrier protein] reductase
VGELDGTVALFTGAGRGMGAAHARLLASEGALVIVQDIDRALAESTAAAIVADGGRAQAMVGDVADVGDLQAKVRAAADAAGGIDILVNNAGIGGAGTLEDSDAAAFDEMFDLPLTGSFFAARAVVPGMKARRAGKIVNVSSIWGMVGHHTHSHYCAAKAALLGLTKAWAKEFAPFGINVNAIAPGGVITEMVLAKGGMAYVEEQANARVLLKRYAEPIEMSYTVLFLVSPRSDFMTGQVISPNGGETIVGF